jgi:hypothetical protein
MARYMALMATILCFLLFSYPLHAAEAEKATGKVFFEALTQKNTTQALQFCDSKIFTYVMYEVGNGYEYACPPAECIKGIIARVNDEWVVSEDRKRIRIAGDNGSLIDPGDYFKGETFFAIADPASLGDYRQMVNYCKIQLLAGNGWVFFTRRVDGKMLIYKMTANALILK